jgi:Tfp pilus assembly PilM family ATPase
MRTSIGVEMNEQYLKISVARAQAPHPKITDCIVESILSLPEDQITKKVSDILRSNRIRPGYSALSLGRNLVTVRNLHLPSHDKKEILQMIDLNVARIVPYRKDEIVFGYKSLGSDEMGYAKIILAIVHSNIIRKQTLILERAGILIDRIALSSTGVWEWVVNACRGEINQTDLYLLLDVETSYVDFIVFSQNAMLFSRSINIGAKSIHEDGLLGITKLLGEVKQSLIMFYNEEMNKKPSAIFLSGATIKTELSRLIETDLDMPLRIVATPFTQEIAKARNRELPPDVSVTGVSAFALKDSEARLNFILPEIQIRKSLREKTREIIVVGSLVIYLFMVGCASFLGKMYEQKAYLAKLEHDYGGVENQMKGLLNEMDKISFSKSYLENRRLPLYIFSQLQKNIPAEIAVNMVSIDEANQVSVRGQAMQLSDVFKFVNTLEKIKNFGDVQAKSTRKKKVKDRDLTEFEITFSIGPAAEEKKPKEKTEKKKK